MTMFTAGENQTLVAHQVGPLSIGLAGTITKEFMYVAPIQDEMLLGMDFLGKHTPEINFKERTMSVHNKAIPIMQREAEKSKATSVCLVNHITLPPNTCINIHCEGKLEEDKSYLVELEDQMPVLGPRLLIKGEKKPLVCLVNMSDREVNLQQGTKIGEAYPVDDIMEEKEDVADVPVSEGRRELPQSMKSMFDEACKNLSEEQQVSAKDLLIEYAGVFAESDLDLGTFTAVKHVIDTGASPPIKHKLRRTPLHFAKEEEEHLNKMLTAGVIQPSVSEWAAAPVLVRKRDGSVRWCVDYRALNKVTKKDVFPLPLIEDCMDALEDNCWFSKLDSNSAYWQIELDPDSRKKSAFVTKNGLFEFVKMPFGLCNSPATYSRALNLVLRGLAWKTVLAFLDDVCVLGRTFEEHVTNLGEVLDRFRSFGLKLKPRKCNLFQKEVSFLGRTISCKGVQMSKESIEAVQNWPTPKDSKEVSQFLGLVNYHRQFICDFSRLSEPLYRIAGTKPYIWTQEQEESFRALKESLVSPPVLAVPTRGDPFILDTDASDKAIAAELIQLQDGQERAIAYGSFALIPAQQRYCTTRKELLAIVRFTRQFRVYLLGRKFGVRTDHASLIWLMNFKEPQGQIARWMEELSQYDMEIIYRPGKQHLNADALSRVPTKASCHNYQGSELLADLPCGGCKYCTRAHKQWHAFLHDVDDVVPLAEPQVIKMKNQIQDAKIASVRCTPHWLEICSAKELEQYQEADPVIAPIHCWLTKGTTLGQEDLALSSPATKFLWLNKEMFIMELGIIYKKDGHKKLLLVPKALQDKIMHLCHDLPMSGHQGTKRTKEKVQEFFYWYGMTQSVRFFVTTCDVCNKNKKPTRHAKGPMVLYHAGAPMERVHMDFLGPLPVTEKGNEFVMVMVDQFTKWVECIPLSSQTAEITAKAAVNEMFCRFGCPFEIFTDQGRNFESELFKSVCELLKIHKARTTAYHPSSNGQVERHNRVLMDAVRCFVSDHQRDWDVLLPQIAAALRSSVNRSTGFTPNRLMLGREVTMPAQLVFGLDKSSLVGAGGDVEGYLSVLETTMSEAHEVARNTLKTNQKHQKRDYDVRLHQHQYRPRDLVYMLKQNSSKGTCPKLSPPWKGPGMILEVLTPYLYRVQLGRQITVVNHDKLKPCKDRWETLPAWVRRVLQSTEDVEGERFCICRLPDDGSLMVQCDDCLEWFHGSCVGVDKKKAQSIKHYYCPNCSL